MDFATIIGLFLAVGAVVGGYNLEGGQLTAIFLTAPILIVVGGTLGATIITTSMSTVQQVPNYLRLAFFGKSHSYNGTIDSIVHLAEKARREGILGLEPEMKKITDLFFRKAMQLVIDGTEITVLRDILETEIAYIEERHKRGIVFFQKAGGFAPASKMASAIAAAFIATLWGVGLANLFLLPVSDKLRMRHDDEMAYLELIMEGMVAIQSGENPRNIRTRLLSFVAPHNRRYKD